MTLDASEYINKSTLAGNETRRLTRAIEEARTPAEKYSLQQDRLNKALTKGAIDQATYNRLLDAAKAKHDTAAKAIDNTNKQLEASNKHVTSATTQLKQMAAAYVGLQTVTKSIRLAIDAEQAAAAFEVLTGSIEESTQLIADLRKISDVSPLTTTGVQDAAKMMLAFNIPLEEVIGNINMLGDVSLGNQARFDSLTLAFSQMSAAGRMMGQDLLQMINAGFNPLQYISQKTGESLVELKARMEDGAISSAEVKDAFKAATSEGGKFSGMMDKMSETMGGKLAIAMADLEKAGIKLGDTLGPVITDFTSDLDGATSSLDVMVGMTEIIVDNWRRAHAFAKDLVSPGDLVHSERLQKEFEERERKRQKALDDATLRKMNERDAARQAAIDQASSQAIQAQRDRSSAQSVGVIASAVSAAVETAAEAFRPQDLLVPTPGELIIADAVEKAVDAIKENSFSRIR